MTEIEGRFFLSTSEVAMKFGVTPRTILRWQEKNPKQLPAVKGINGRLYFPKEAVDDIINNMLKRAKIQ